MMENCPAFDTGLAFAPQLLGLIDCDATQLAQSGFGALAVPGSPATLAIGGLLTLLVALLGYRLILGGRLDLSEQVVTMVKIGLVLAFATQWPAYQAVFYNLALKGPEELLAQLPLGEANDPQLLPARLQGSYNRLAALETPPQTTASGTAKPVNDPYAAVQLPPSPLTSHGDFLAFRPMSAGLFLLGSGLFALALPRTIAGLMLALGPLFIGFLLFEGTKSIFLGWVRVLAWTILATTLSTLILAIELNVVEPQIAALIAALGSGDPELPLLGQLIATTCVFALLLAGGLVVAIAPTRLVPLFSQISRTKDEALPQFTQNDHRILVAQMHARGGQEQRSRVQIVGDRMTLAADAQERVRAISTASIRKPEGQRSLGRSRSEVVSPLGQSYRRAGVSRRNIGPARRNMTT